MAIMNMNRSTNVCSIHTKTLFLKEKKKEEKVHNINLKNSNLDGMLKNVISSSISIQYLQANIPSILL